MLQTLLKFRFSLNCAIALASFGFFFATAQTAFASCAVAPGQWNSAGTCVSQITYTDTGGAGLNKCQYKVVSSGQDPNTIAWKDAVGTCAGTSVTLETQNITIGNPTIGNPGDCSVEGTAACTLYAQATDQVGNATQAPAVIYRYNIDYTLPVVSATNADSNTWYQSRQATLSATDSGGSDSLDARYALDTSTDYACSWQGTGFFNGQVLSMPSGSHHLYLCAKDGAGNVGKLDAGIYKVDPSPPTISYFTVSPIYPPNSVTPGQPTLIVSWAVADTGGSHLKDVTIWRAVYNASTCNGTNNSACGSWSLDPNATPPLPPANSDTWGTQQNPISYSYSPTGDNIYEYGIHVLDNAQWERTETQNNLSTKEVRIKLTNAAPTLSLATLSPNSPFKAGVQLTFTGNWTDPEQADGEQSRLFICKNNGIPSGNNCSGGSTNNWCVSSLSTTSPSTCNYTTQTADQGTQTYYAFECDNDKGSLCSPVPSTPPPNTSTSGTFLVDATAPTISSFSVSPVVPSWVNGASPNVTVSWTVSDAGGSHLRKVVVYRAPYDSSFCNDTDKSQCQWNMVGDTWDTIGAEGSAYLVKPYLVYPADKPMYPEYKTAVEKYLLELQNWYRDRVQKPFNIAPLQVVRSSYNYVTMRCGETPSQACLTDPSKLEGNWGAYMNKAIHNGIEKWDMHTVALIFSAGGGGYAGGNRYPDYTSFAITGDWVLEPISGVPNTWGIPCSYSNGWQCSGGVPKGSPAHELGHGFGLPHPGTQYADQTIMQWHGNFPLPGLLNQEITFLQDSPFFPNYTDNGPWLHSLSDTPPDGTYWYGMHVLDNAANETTESQAGLTVKKVQVDKTAPGTPTLSSPSGTVNTTTPTFNWNTITDPSGVTYTLWVDNNNDFNSREINQSGLSSSPYTPSSGVLFNGQTYYAKVRAVDGAGNPGNFSSVNTFTIVLNQPPQAVSLQDDHLTANYCSTTGAPIPPPITLSWQYQDPDAGAYESAYQVQISTNNFGTILFDSGKVSDPVNTIHNGDRKSYAPPAGTFGYNTAYYWRVMVWDDQNAPSSFAQGSSFSTPSHYFPIPDFTWSPASPSANEQVQFTDQTNFSPSATSKSWSWNFGDNSSSNQQNPKNKYKQNGSYAVLLTASDNAGSCSKSKTVNIGIPFPRWQEISPF